MAIFKRFGRREEEAESVFISMTDIMISILFVVMIVMAFFAKSARQVPAELDVLQQQVVTLQQENEALRTEIAALKDELDIRINDQNQLYALRQDNLRLRELLAGFELTNSALTERLKSLEVENSQLKALIVELTAEIERLKQQIEELQSQIRADPMDLVLSAISDDKQALLDSLERQLRAAGIKVIVDQVSGVIRFGEDAIQFGSGSHEPSELAKTAMRKIADILANELRCYILGVESEISTSCNANGSIIEAVQIEGHTDSVGSQLSNLELSTRRATETYRVMTRHRPDLELFLNANYLLDRLTQQDVLLIQPGEQVLSVSGYGENRPVNFMERNDDERRVNRRIDIRFIMTTPKDVTEIESLTQLIFGSMGFQETAN